MSNEIEGKTDPEGSAVLFGRRALPRVGVSLPVTLQIAGLPCGLAARTRDDSV